MAYERLLRRGFVGELVRFGWEIFSGMRSEMRVGGYVEFFLFRVFDPNWVVSRCY